MNKFKVVYDNLVTDDVIEEIIEAGDIEEAWEIAYEHSKGTGLSEGNFDMYVDAMGKWVDIYDVFIFEDIEYIRWEKSESFPEERRTCHTLKCQIEGEPATLRYDVYDFDDGQGFSVRCFASDGREIEGAMVEPEMKALERKIADAVEYGQWCRALISSLAGADTMKKVSDIRDVYYKNPSIDGQKEKALEEAVENRLSEIRDQKRSERKKRGR